MIQTVFFDMDGTLIDTERLYLKSNAQTAREYGVNLPDDAFLALVGMGASDMGTWLADHVGAENVTAFIDRSEGLVSDWLAAGQGVEMPGATAMLEHLTAAGFRLGVVTAAPGEHLVDVLREMDWGRFFTWQVSSSDAPSKPAPDGYLHALKLAGTPAEATVAVEDTPLGVQAARAAGLRCLQIVDLAPASPEATAQLDSLAAVTAWLTQNA